MGRELLKEKRKMNVCIIIILVIMLLLTSFAYTWVVTQNQRQIQLDQCEEDVMVLMYKDLIPEKRYLLENLQEGNKVMLYGLIEEYSDRNDTYVCYFDENSEIWAETSNFTLCYLSDKNAEEPEFSTSCVLLFDDFKASVSEEDYKEICEYLQQKEEDKFSYSLVCSKYYLDEATGICYPCELQITDALEDDGWYAGDNDLKTYNLKPKATIGTLKEAYYKRPNEVERDFVLGKYEISDRVNSLKLPMETNYGGGITNDLGFKFNYTMNMETLYNVRTFESPNKHDDTYMTLWYSYNREVNLLKICSAELIIGTSLILVFYILAGIVILLLVWYVFKRAFTAEQMRLEMTDALAHNLKNPLFIISGAAETLDEVPEKATEYTEIIRVQAKEMNRLVMQMLSNSKLSSGKYKLKKEAVSLTELTEEIIKSRCDRDVEISTDYIADKIITADRELMRLCIENLIDNACKYTEDEKVHIVIDSNYMTISNSASGMKQSDVKKIWKRYYRGNSKNKYGTGLGLSVVSQVLKLHRFRYTSTLENGVYRLQIKVK